MRAAGVNVRVARAREWEWEREWGLTEEVEDKGGSKKMGIEKGWGLRVRL